ncbi:molybdenum ABC transporter ATP-binding protein [Pasteurellaceae bacterium 15-036681]|nr:molybdenum ABC transporter ATP-binding protein [Pasteurellaceae bacterium 15-036681]
MLSISIEQQLGEIQLQANLNIPSQGVTAIFGRSGAGKSSLINLVAGLSTAQKGKIVLNDRVLFDSEKRINLPPEKRKVGYVFQEHRLFPHYTVQKNLAYGYKGSDFDKILQIAELLGISHLLDRFPNSLSGGEKQRVAIGRALLTEPDILLMDEPLSALDIPRKKELLDYLSELAKNVKIPILYVSHSLDEVVLLADRLVLIEQGKIVAYDTVSNVWQSPEFAIWQPDLQKVSLLELPISAAQTDYKMQSLAIGEQQIWINQQDRHQIGDLVRITIASRDVSIALEKPMQSSIRNILQGSICKISPEPDRFDVAVSVGKEKIWASISRWSFDELQLFEGQTVYLQVKTVSI